MLDEKAREAIALKRFSLISPVLNGQVKIRKNILMLFPINLLRYLILE
ncbi:hypothetical protein TheetDRAFT_1535 [Thermoanaerobacter ethanolicus JW 200]|nr:hypothetical protein TheetDRAFT_1535 [Thermoanaerobacter ethanolicus JW 200]